MLIIRNATTDDAARILEIYRPYVEHSVITFEETVPSLDEFKQRIEQIQQSYPYLIAEENGTLLGYAYANRFNARASYRWTAEVTIYLASTAQGKGLGRHLYTLLEQLLQEQGIINLMALITSPGQGSVEFHRHLGYREVGLYPQVAYKFNQWHHLAILQKQLKQHPNPPTELLPPKQIIYHTILN